jgi:Helicase conserved C-terminal domain
MGPRQRYAATARPGACKILHLLRGDLRRGAGNSYFVSLYRDRALGLRRLSSAEHTGQVEGNLRDEREVKFRSGELPVLFCSPTMELGVDIRDLAVVHLATFHRPPPIMRNEADAPAAAGDPRSSWRFRHTATLTTIISSATASK